MICKCDCRTESGKKTSLKTGRTGGLPYVGTGWYRTTFKAPQGKHTTLVFDGAMSEARVYVNGKRSLLLALRLQLILL